MTTTKKAFSTFGRPERKNNSISCLNYLSSEKNQYAYYYNRGRLYGMIFCFEKPCGSALIHYVKNYERPLPHISIPGHHYFVTHLITVISF